MEDRLHHAPTRCCLRHHPIATPSLPPSLPIVLRHSKYQVPTPLRSRTTLPPLERAVPKVLCDGRGIVSPSIREASHARVPLSHTDAGLPPPASLIPPCSFALALSSTRHVSGQPPLVHHHHIPASRAHFHHRDVTQLPPLCGVVKISTCLLRACRRHRLVRLTMCHRPFRSPRDGRGVIRAIPSISRRRLALVPHRTFEFPRLPLCSVSDTTSSPGRQYTCWRWEVGGRGETEGAEDADGAWTG